VIFPINVGGQGVCACMGCAGVRRH